MSSVFTSKRDQDLISSSLQDGYSDRNADAANELSLVNTEEGQNLTAAQTKASQVYNPVPVPTTYGSIISQTGWLDKIHHFGDAFAHYSKALRYAVKNRAQVLKDGFQYAADKTSDEVRKHSGAVNDLVAIGRAHV